MRISLSDSGITSTSTLKMTLKKYIDFQNINTFVLNKNSAKLGDALVNMIYSFAKTLVLGKATGCKVSDAVLSNAYFKSDWYVKRDLILSGKKGVVADAIEAMVLFFWLFSDFEIDYFVSIIAENLDSSYLHHHHQEQITATKAFQSLLTILYHDYKKGEIFQI